MSPTESEPFTTPPARTSRTGSTTSSPGGGTGDEYTPRRQKEEQKQGITTATRLPADVTENLPSCLLRITSLDKVKDVTKEAKEKGDGGDLDDEAEDFLDHDAAMVEEIVEWQEGTEDEEVVDDSDQNYVVLL
jgi:hypothetical protein